MVVRVAEDAPTAWEVHYDTPCLHCDFHRDTHVAAVSIVSSSWSGEEKNEEPRPAHPVDISCEEKGSAMSCCLLVVAYLVGTEGSRLFGAMC